MNMYRAFRKWNTPAADAAPPQRETVQSLALDADLPDNVVPLKSGTPLDTPAGLHTPFATQESKPVQPRGLMDAPELQAFFDDNHFGLGRHNGAHYKTQDALELGRQRLVSEFQNALETLISKKQAKVDELRNMALQTQGVCATVTGQLSLACQRLERDMVTLQTQSDLAADGKGWVLRALNEYQIGFGKGLREAIDMELLG